MLFSGPFFNDGRFVLQGGAKLVSGGIYVDIPTGGGEWCEFLVSLPETMDFEPGKNYKISYDYTVSKAQDNTQFYQFLRVSGNSAKDLGWAPWEAKPGEKGRKEFTVEPKEPGYSLIFGVRYAGSIRIDNLRIEEIK